MTRNKSVTTKITKFTKNSTTPRVSSLAGWVRAIGRIARHAKALGHLTAEVRAPVEVPPRRPERRIVPGDGAVLQAD